MRYVGEGVAAMTGQLSPIDKAKFVAAKKAVDYVEDGMRVGLGTGSTAAWMVRCLGELVRNDGLKIRGVPTSTRTAELAREVGIEVISLDEAKWLDLTIDGADEFDAELNLIKGGGGALLQEKIVATASDQMIVIADAAKEVGRLPAAGRSDPVRLADHARIDRGNADFRRRSGPRCDAAHEWRSSVRDG
jgi:ribose 5-phosphate isomerase A